MADTRQELVDVLGARRKQALRLDRPVEDQERPSPLKRSRTPSAILETLAHKLAQVAFMIKTKRSWDTVVDWTQCKKRPKILVTKNVKVGSGVRTVPPTDQ